MESCVQNYGQIQLAIYFVYIYKYVYMINHGHLQYIYGQP